MSSLNAFFRRFGPRSLTAERCRQINADNNKKIVAAGYKVNEWMPGPEMPVLRAVEEVKGRLSVMIAMANIAFHAPVDIIGEWIDDQEMSRYLSAGERMILQKENDDLELPELISLQWYLEGIWALMWATKMIDQLPAETYVGDNMQSMLPNLQDGEGNEKIMVLKTLRDEQELYTMLDYYYRLHWYCVEERLKGRKALLDEGLVYARRKALEWICNSNYDWDTVDMGT